MDADGASFPKISSTDAGTGNFFATFPFSRLLKTSQSLSQQAVCALAVQGSTLNSWNVAVSRTYSSLVVDAQLLCSLLLNHAQRSAAAQLQVLTPYV